MEVQPGQGIITMRYNMYRSGQCKWIDTVGAADAQSDARQILDYEWEHHHKNWWDGN